MVRFLRWMHALAAPAVVLGEVQQPGYQRAIESGRRQVGQRLSHVAAIERYIPAQIRPVILKLLQHHLFDQSRIGQSFFSDPLDALEPQQLLGNSGDFSDGHRTRIDEVIRPAMPARLFDQFDQGARHPVHRHDILLLFPRQRQPQGQATRSGLDTDRRDAAPSEETDGQFEKSIKVVIGARVAGAAVADDDRRTVDGRLDPGEILEQLLGGELTLLVGVAAALTNVQFMLVNCPAAIAAEKGCRDVMYLGHSPRTTQFQQAISAVDVRFPRLAVRRRVIGDIGRRVNHGTGLTHQPGTFRRSQAKTRRSKIAFEERWTRQWLAERFAGESKQFVEALGGGSLSIAADQNANTVPGGE